MLAILFPQHSISYAACKWKKEMPPRWAGRNDQKWWRQRCEAKYVNIRITTWNTSSIFLSVYHIPDRPLFTFVHLVSVKLGFILLSSYHTQPGVNPSQCCSPPTQSGLIAFSKSRTLQYIQSIYCIIFRVPWVTSNSRGTIMPCISQQL